jgi:bifunctional non-homologous end joining protein LigD
MPRRAAAASGLVLPAVEPMLATPARVLPAGHGFATEVKWDGIRCVARISAGTVLLTGRHGTDLTPRFPEITAALTALTTGPVTVDGEIVRFDERGRPSFALLQQRIHLTRDAAVRRLADTGPATFLAFDALHLDRPTLHLPYSRRREMLAALGLEGERVRTPPHWTGSSAKALAWTAEHGLEGVVAKRLDSPYRPGARTTDWIKVKHLRTVDVVIGGWIPGGPQQNLVKSLLCGVPEAAGLRYTGNVGSGLTQAERRALATALLRLETGRPPFVNTVDPPGRGDTIRWVRPVLTAEVEYLEWTEPRHRLRHPVWRGLREP